MIYLIAFIVFMINIPFGFWRGSTRKFSLAWFLAIHVPVLFSIGLRFLSGIETQFLTILIFISIFFVGQFTGKYWNVIYNARKQRNINE